MQRARVLLIAMLILAMAPLSRGAMADPLKIRIGWSTMPGHMIPVLYSKPEILKYYGNSYTVEPILFRGSSPQISAMAANEIDMAAFAPLVLALSVLNARLDVRVVADVIQDGVAGHHTETFLVRSDSGINSVADMKGKRVGTNAVGSASDTAVKAMFRKNGLLENRDYSTVEVAFPNIPAMLDEHKIDMGTVLQPMSAKLRATGNYKTLFTAKDAVGQQQLVFLAARNDFLTKNRAALLDFFEDHVRAMRWFTDPANHQEAVAIIAKFMKQSPDDLAYLFTDQDYFRDPYLIPNVPGIQSIVDVSQQIGLLPQRIEVAPKYVDLSFVEEAKKRLTSQAK